ncbi:hypothetical protein [Amycolatopsis pittospori]|uniref:hypothetical protein n=1 Tax=Amycolatopsis pittospori TaxID=2749434 RepID=UPI0015F0946D|nr:hypothetical protein [Amycolatopsis pittospori]
MRKLFTSAVIALSVLGLSGTANAAEQPKAMQPSCSEGQTDENVTALQDIIIYYKYVTGVGCTVMHFIAAPRTGNTHTDQGHWYAWGPRGWWATSSKGAYRDTKLSAPMSLPLTTYTGDLWCARFIRTDGSVKTESCATATPYS